jgi:hypothetical protein
MMDRKLARTRAQEFVSKCNGPIGPIPLQRVLRGNIEFFDELRLSGGTWEQIAALLHGEGLRTQRGEVVSAAVLRALYGREAKRRTRVGSVPLLLEPPPSESRGQTEAPAKAAAPFPPKDIGGNRDGRRSTIAERMRRASSMRGGHKETDEKQ